MAWSGAQDTDWGTREFAVTDLDNNLLVFFRPRSQASGALPEEPSSPGVTASHTTWS
ncbi:hypothetical protein BH24ACT8_BH24ACT8_19020 [soil metagenome]